MWLDGWSEATVGASFVGVQLRPHRTRFNRSVYGARGKVERFFRATTPRDLALAPDPLEAWR